MNTKPLKVCCFPLSLEENTVLDLIYDPVRALDVELSSYDWFLSNFKRADIFDIHWPDAVVMGRSKPRAMVKVAALLLSVFIFKRRGARIVYHVHNIGSHDKLHPELEKSFWQLFLPKVDVFVHMNAASVARFKSHFPNTQDKRHEVIFLPHYRETLIAPERPRSETRAKHGLDEDAHVYFCFGLLRPYKGLEDLISAFNNLSPSTPKPVQLLIAGRPFDPEYGRQLELLAAKNSQIKMIMRFLSEPELHELLKACDTIVMAHRKINNSGISLMALSANRRLIAPSRGAMPELAHIVGDEWVTLFDNLDVDILREDLSKPLLDDNNQPDLSAFEPRLLGRKLVDLFQELTL